MIVDMNHYIGNDLSVGPTGDIAVTSSTVMGQQRILRRLITNPLDYIWHPDYGGGVGKMVGKPANAAIIKGVIRGQISKEAAVAARPAASTDISASNTGVVAVTIRYVDADTGTTQVLSLPV